MAPKGDVFHNTSQHDLIDNLPHLQTILNNVGSYIYTKDVGGHYTYVNAKVQRLFSCPYEEIVGETDDRFLHLSNLDEFKSYDFRVMPYAFTKAPDWFLYRTPPSNFTIVQTYSAPHLVPGSRVKPEMTMF